MSFVMAGLACIFSALCYAEFASMAPVAGSAYTYAYVTLGEMFAWIIGWDLVLEYTVASATVAHGWSKYFQNFIGIFDLSVPHVVSNAPFEFDPTKAAFAPTGTWFDLPALIIVAILTVVLVIGIRESARFNNTMVAIKVAIVLMVIGVGAFFVKTVNWQPFAPFGWAGLSLFGKPLWGQTGADGTPVGMLAGAAMIFFAYIGFDSVSTHAEEARNPRRDVPFGIIASLLVCTILYIAVTLVLTGMVPYDEIDVDAPVAMAFQRAGLGWAQFIISLGAVAGITSVMLVLMLSQPRVLLAMARDGLLPESFFGAVHPRFRTPWKSTILTGFMVGILASFIPLGILAELVNIGTLLAFVIVCLAVLVMRYIHPQSGAAVPLPVGAGHSHSGRDPLPDPDAVAALWELGAAVRLDGGRHVHLLPLRPPPQCHGPPKARSASRQRRLRTYDAVRNMVCTTHHPPLTLPSNLVTVPLKGCEVGRGLAGAWDGRAAIC